MEVLVLGNEITRGMEIKLRRTARNLRQGDVAYLATQQLRSRGAGYAHFVVTPNDISGLETGGTISRIKTNAVLNVLGMEADHA